MAERRYTHDRDTHNQRAARRVVPHLMERFAPTTVLDVGCGLGTWLRVFADQGCDVTGLEGEHLPEAMLDVPPDRIRVVDLEGHVAPPGRFDLAVCLEVAEHLTPAAGDRLIELLTDASDVIVFSAAIPGQGGDHHLNEQWPEYWRARFASRGFALEDSLRAHFWDDEDVEWWYRQNMFVARRGGDVDAPAKALVHPRLLEKKVRIEEDFYRGRVPVKTGVVVLARALLRALGLRS